MAEAPCREFHASLGDAIRHAERLLRFPPRWQLHNERLHVGAEYCFGAMTHNLGTVIGRQMGPRLRWRLDFDGSKGAHVNDEDSTTGRKTVHPIPGVGYEWVNRVWRKWTTQASSDDKAIQDAAYAYLRQRRVDPRISILEVCERRRPLSAAAAAKFASAVQAYLDKYNYLPGMF